jgi:hypothetical protein
MAEDSKKKTENSDREIILENVVYGLRDNLIDAAELWLKCSTTADERGKEGNK